MFSNAQKAKIADVIHEVICERTGRDGVDCCMAYAVVGAGVLSDLAKRLYLPQAGTIQIDCDRQSEWAFTMDGSGGLAPVGEFHCWIAEVPKNKPIGGAGLQRMAAGTLTLIDFSSRHYLAMVARSVSLCGILPEWKIEAPPAFIWTNRLPSWLYLKPEVSATNMLLMELDSFIPSIWDALNRIPRWCQPVALRCQTNMRKRRSK